MRNSYQQAGRSWVAFSRRRKTLRNKSLDAAVPGERGEELVYSGQEMSSLIGVAAGLGIPSTLLLGKMADGFAPHLLLWCCMAGNVLAFLILWTLPSFSLLVTALFIFGFAGGGFLPVYATFIGRLFGPASFGRVMGLGGIVMLPFGALSPVLIGAMRDGSGSYEGALLLPVSATAVGAYRAAWEVSELSGPYAVACALGRGVPAAVTLAAITSLEPSPLRSLESQSRYVAPAPMRHVMPTTCAASVWTACPLQPTPPATLPTAVRICAGALVAMPADGGMPHTGLSLLRSGFGLRTRS